MGPTGSGAVCGGAFPVQPGLTDGAFDEEANAELELGVLIVDLLALLQDYLTGHYPLIRLQKHPTCPQDRQGRG